MRTETERQIDEERHDVERAGRKAETLEAEANPGGVPLCSCDEHYVEDSCELCRETFCGPCLKPAVDPVADIYKDRVCPGCRDDIEKIETALMFREYRDKIAGGLKQIDDKVTEILMTQLDAERRGAGLGFISGTVTRLQMLYDLMPEPAEQGKAG